MSDPVSVFRQNKGYVHRVRDIEPQYPYSSLLSYQILPDMRRLPVGACHRTLLAPFVVIEVIDTEKYLSITQS